MKINLSKEIKGWVAQAKADLKTAKDCLIAGNYYASVLFSQQCAEKSLKGLFIRIMSKLPPKIHDLVELGRLVNLPNSIKSLTERLSGTYFTSRYPGVAPQIPVKFMTKLKQKLI